MKIYLKENVYDAALDRIRFLFDEFENIVITTSGGKDSTVILNLSLQVATEKNRLPLKVMFIDQEAEWAMVIDHIRDIMNDPRVEPYWLQVPIRIFNSTSTIKEERWLNCWAPGEEWMRPKEPNSIHENIYGTDRFKELFPAFLQKTFGNKPCATIGGIRAEESKQRLVGMTNALTYKHITWGKREDKRYPHYGFHPIYDWMYTDVWKAIHDNNWPYCPVYDYMYQYGVPVKMMRVSNVHHETAVHALFFLQELEPDTWNKLTKRIGGINTAGQMQSDNFFFRGDLPFMFSSWKEYRDYLTDNLIEADVKPTFIRQFNRMDRMFSEGKITGDADPMYKAQINAVLVNDYHFTKLDAYCLSHSRYKDRSIK